MRKMNPIIAPAVSPLAGPRATPTTITAAIGQHREHLARREQEGADHAGPDLRPRRAARSTLVGLAAERRAGVVGADRLGAGDDLGDGGEHLAVALAGLRRRRRRGGAARRAARTPAARRRRTRRGRGSSRRPASRPPTISISGPSSSQASPPHWKNWASVSMSLVTRATSAPRRSSLWSARLSRWMWAISRARRSYSACSLRRAEAHDGRALGDGGDDQRDGGDRRPARRRSRRARSPSSTMPLSIACCRRIGTTTRPVAPTAARHHVSAEPLAQHGRLLRGRG